jgi:Tol biopolymer transport system component/DNA-binding winged helix-turn-helix (wHTH) protein
MNSEDAVTTQESVVYEFAEYRLVVRDRMLYCDSELVPLAPKACEVLLTLVQSGGRLVGKQEIMDRVWPDAFVEEANLTHHISALRRAFLNDKQEPRFIETIPRRGYRFIAPVRTVAPPAVEITISDRSTTRVIEEVEIEADDPQLAKTPVSSPVRRAPWLSSPRKNVGLGQVAVVAGIFIGLAGAAALVWFFFFRPHPAPEQVRLPMVMSRVTNSGKQGASSISPDGKFICYVQNFTHGLGAVYVRQTETNIETRLATHEKGEFGTTRFSPDGAFVYYLVHDVNETQWALYRVAVLGGPPVRLVRDLLPKFALSPDGTRIAALRDDAATKQRRVIILPLVTGVEQLVFSRPWTELDIGYTLAWSPDAQTIVFVGATAADTKNFTQGASRLMAVNVNGGELKVLSGETFIEIGQAEWMPDGSGVVFIALRPHQRNQIYFLALPSGELHRVTNDANGYGNYGLGITADGRTLVADVWELQGRVWSMDANGDTESAVLLPTGSTFLASGLTDLPDGRIIFSSRGDLYFDLWTMEAGASEARPLMSDPAYDLEPVSAPDGSYVVFTSDRAGGSHLFRISPDGSDLRQLTSGESFDNNPDVSPDGNWIVYHARTKDPATNETSDNIWKIPSAGGTPVRLTDFAAFVPAFSPNGRLISCVIPTDNNGGRIVVIGADGGAPVKSFDETFQRHFEIPVRWTPDGQNLLFRKTDNEAFNLWQQPLAGGKPTQFTRFSSDVIYSFLFSRNGKKLLLSRGSSVVNVVMIKDFPT